WLEGSSPAHPGVARRILEKRQCHGRKWRAEPEPRIRRARRGLHGIRRTALPRRAAPQGILRRPFPHRIPIPGRGSQTRRREFFLRRRLGISGPGQPARPAQGTARLRGSAHEHEELQMNLTLKVWRQSNANTPGRFETYEAKDVLADMSFLEMLDVVNEGLIERGQEPIAFDSDCREGICGMCSLVINGIPHGGHRGTATCQLHMRHFEDGQTITIEPWRAKAFPLVKDLVVNRSAFDRIIQKGGFVSVNTGGTPDGNAI